MAVLSGSICIISQKIRDAFTDLAIGYGIAKQEIKFQSVYNDYSEVLLPSSKKSKVVGIITDLFTAGRINIIIGTKSLLGEGWDCPVINSLVMATFIGSYMLTNQMRGRAIRTDLHKPRKTSNIRHLMCLDYINVQNNMNNQFICPLCRKS